jgi:hypothetical protein
MRNSNSVADKLNIKNYRSFSKKSDFEIKQINEVNGNTKDNNNNNDNNIIKKINIIPNNNNNNNNSIINNINNISINNNKALPVLNIGEPKINNKSLELDYSKNNNSNNSPDKKILVHSGSQKLIISNSNKKILNGISSGVRAGPGKILNKNISSELPSLNILNQKNRNINHLNEIYKIYAPYLNKPQIKNNLKYKAYNNNNYYLRNIQRYYKVEKPNIINGNGKKYNPGYQLKINRIGSGRKILPNRKLSPLKRNIINIC